jgi:hypothetical protein
MPILTMSTLWIYLLLKFVLIIVFYEKTYFYYVRIFDNYYGRS